VAALGGADGPGHADVVGAGGEGVVGALAEGRADGVDGRQVDDVEAHVGDRLQPARGGAEGAVGAFGGALGAGEEFVPGAVQRPLPLHQQRQWLGGGHQVPQRVSGQHLLDLRGRRRGVALLDRQRVVEQRARCRPQHRAGLAPRRPAGRPLVQLSALLQDQARVDAGGNLDRGVPPPGGDRVAPGLHRVRPAALRVRRHLRAPAVRARRQLTHADRRAAAAFGVLQDDVRGDRVVPLAEDGGGDQESLTHDRFRRAPAALHARTDVAHRDASDGPGGLHAEPPPCSIPGRRPDVG
jgi:hypothetical protein